MDFFGINEEEFDFSYDDDDMGLEYDPYYLYDAYIMEMAKQGFTLSLADQMQSLGSWDTTIGTRLRFQMLESHQMAQLQEKCGIGMNHQVHHQPNL